MKTATYQRKSLLLTAFIILGTILFPIEALYGQAGTLDSSFGEGGIVTTGFMGSTSDIAMDILSSQYSDKLLVAGRSVSERGADFSLARYNADGSLDTSFDGDGKVRSNIFDAWDAAHAVVEQADGKVVIAGYANIDNQDDFMLARFNMDGSLDVGFGNNGTVTTDFFGDYDRVEAMGLQQDGKIVVAGTIEENDSRDFGLARYNVDGSLDASFGAGGKVVTHLFSTLDNATSLAIQPDGNILVGGYTYLNFQADFALVRYLPDGSLDATFGTNGIATTDFFGRFDTIQTIALQDDGKIVAAGHGSMVTGPSNFNLVRYNPDGSLDTGFGVDGKVITEFEDRTALISDVGVFPNGRILATGYFDNVDGWDFALVRYMPDGSIDTRFGDDGKVITDFGGSFDEPNAVLLYDNGKAIAAGRSNLYNANDYVLAKYNRNGSLDAAFGDGGKVRTDFIGPSSDTAVDLVIDPNENTFIVLGAISVQGPNRFALGRYNLDGSLDESFGSSGFVESEFLGEGDVANAVALQPDGKIVVAGGANNGASQDVALARYNPDGSFDADFGNSGVIITDITGDFDTGSAMVLSPDGKIVVAGSANNMDNLDFALLVYNLDGSLDASFGDNGIVTTDFSNGSDDGRAVLLQEDGKIIVAGTSSNSFGLARYNVDGSLDTSFGIEGKVTTIITPGFQTLHDASLQEDGKILVSGTTDAFDFTVVRYNPDGSLDLSFDDDGIVTTDFSFDVNTILALQPDGKIIAVGNVIQNSPDFAVMRYNSDGSLDTSFGTDGKAQFDFSDEDADNPHAVTVQPDGNILIGGLTSQDLVGGELIIIRVLGDTPLMVTSFTLIDADADLPVPGFDPIVEGTVLDMNQVPPSLNVRANVTNNVESVRFSFLGNDVFHIENIPPYALFGDVGDDYNGGQFGTGLNTLTATPYSQDQLAGEEGISLTLNFTVVNGGTASAYNEGEIQNKRMNPVPKEFVLETAYPNPFNPETTIRFGVPERTNVRLSVYDMLGREVALLVDGLQDPGYYEIRFDASGLPSGAYLYRLDSSAGSFTRKMLFLK